MLAKDLAYVLNPGRDYLQHKYDDHRQFSIVISAFLALLWASLWQWDSVVDPIGAEHTLGLRLLYLAAMFISLALYIVRKHSPWITIFTVTGMLVAELNFVLILNHLNTGMVYGLAGFMYVMFIAVLTLQSFSLIANIAYTLLAAALPHIAALIGVSHLFQHDQYAALIWPAAMLTILAQIVQSHHYLIRYRLEHKLRQLSITDPMTGAKNRRYFIPYVAKEISKARRAENPLSLLMLDIDHFKAVNDRYGHPTGDIVICNLVDICQQTIRQTDEVARLGGEEFAVLLLNSTEQDALKIAEKIRKTVEEHMVTSLEQQTFKFTVSIGLTELNNSDQHEHDFISRADKALYRAKETGRNKVVAA